MQVDVVMKNAKRGVFRQSDEQQCTIYIQCVCACVCVCVCGMEVEDQHRNLLFLANESVSIGC